MGPWAFGVPLILVSTLGLLLNGYVLLVVLGLSKQVSHNDQIFGTPAKYFSFPTPSIYLLSYGVFDTFFANQVGFPR